MEADMFRSLSLNKSISLSHSHPSKSTVQQSLGETNLAFRITVETVSNIIYVSAAVTSTRKFKSIGKGEGEKAATASTALSMRLGSS